MTRIILVRHGQSESNLKGIFTGQLDYSLTDLGERQAEKMAEYLDKLKIDAIFSSDLSRAVVTANKIATRQGVEVVKSPAFREINAGVWQGMEFDDIVSTYPKSYEVWKQDLAKSHPDGGESCKETYERAVAKLKEIIKENDGKTICIVFHAVVLRCVASYLYGKGAKGVGKIGYVPNCSVSIFESNDNKTYTCTEFGTYSYLDGMITELSDRI